MDHEAGAVGAFGTVVLAAFYGKFKWDIIKGVNYSAALTIGMIFFIVIAATCFAYVFRSLGGDDVVEGLTKQGVDIVTPVSEAPDGGLTADFSDPDGYILSLHQPAGMPRRKPSAEVI